MLQASFSDVAEHALVLSKGPVRKLIVGSFPALARRVVLLNPVVHEGELLEASHKLLYIADLAVVLRQVTKLVIGIDILFLLFNND